MNKWVLVPMLSIITIGHLAFANQTKETDTKQRFEYFNERYISKTWRTFRNGEEVAFSLYDSFLEINRDYLGDKAKRLYDDVLDIFKTPTSDAAWLHYFDDFPKKYTDYCELFCAYNRELYKHGNVFIYMLEDFLKERPRTSAGFVLGLAKDAGGGPGDEVALYQLNHILVAHICDFYDLFISEFNKLGMIDQDNVIKFVCYAEGTCFEIYRSDDSCCIIKRLKEKNNIELLERFIGIAKKMFNR